MATTRYEEALRQVQSLSHADQQRLLTDVAEQLKLENRSTSSILELQGLGKEIWNRVDVETYLDEERASWNG